MIRCRTKPCIDSGRIVWHLYLISYNRFHFLLDFCLFINYRFYQHLDVVEGSLECSRRFRAKEVLDFWAINGWQDDDFNQSFANFRGQKAKTEALFLKFIYSHFVTFCTRMILLEYSYRYLPNKLRENCDFFPPIKFLYSIWWPVFFLLFFFLSTSIKKVKFCPGESIIIFGAITSKLPKAEVFTILE